MLPLYFVLILISLVECKLEPVLTNLLCLKWHEIKMLEENLGQ